MTILLKDRQANMKVVSPVVEAEEWFNHPVIVADLSYKRGLA